MSDIKPVVAIPIIAGMIVGFDQLYSYLHGSRSYLHRLTGYGLKGDELTAAENEEIVIPNPNFTPSDQVNTVRYRFSDFVDAHALLTRGLTVSQTQAVYLRAASKPQHVHNAEIRLEYIYTPEEIVRSTVHPARNNFTGIPLNIGGKGSVDFQAYKVLYPHLLSTNYPFTAQQRSVLEAGKKRSTAMSGILVRSDFYSPQEILLVYNPARQFFKNIS